MNEVNSTIQNIITTSKKYSFLVGAGVSMNEPTNLPSARQIVRVLLKKVLPKEETENVLKLPNLRYEMVVEQIQKYIDPELIFMDYFELVKTPNSIHFLLALAIISGHHVSTTNFDYLIEIALTKLLPKEEQNKIAPIIEKNDFINPSDYQKYKLYKLHGSKRNVITRKDTSTSLITTISALGKDRELNKTFTIEGYKKDGLLQIFQNNCLILMGYSGSDDFDISPLLLELPNLEKLIWIDHSNEDAIEFKSIKSEGFRERSSEKKETSRTENLLKNISSRSKFEVIYIKANTFNFIKNYLWKSITNKDFRDFNQLLATDIKYYDFFDWISDKYSEIDEIKKYQIASHLYFNLGRNKDVIRTCEKAIDLLNDLEQFDPRSLPKADFYHLLGLVNRMKGDFEQSSIQFNEAKINEMLFFNQAGVAKQIINIGDNNKLQTLYEQAEQNYLEARETYIKVNDLDGQLIVLHRLGELARLTNVFSKAEDYLTKASGLITQTGNLERKAAILNSLGMMFYQKGEFSSALNNFQEAFDIVDKIGDMRLKGDCIENMGLIYEAQSNYEDAILSYQKALEADMFMDNTVGIISRMKRMGDIFIKIQKVDEALMLYQRALEIYNNAMKETQVMGPMGKSELLMRIGNSLKLKARYSEAITYFHEGIMIEMYLFRPIECAKYAIDIAESYEMLGDKQSASVHYKDALSHLGGSNLKMKNEIEEKLRELSQ